MTYSGYCALRVVYDNGSPMQWRDVTATVRRRSGRSVRPNAMTLRGLRDAAYLELKAGFVHLTVAGRAALAAAASRRGVPLATKDESLVVTIGGTQEGR